MKLVNLFLIAGLASQANARESTGFEVQVVGTNECAPCVWPFEYDGKTYTEGYCRYSTGLRGKWCATETNEKNVYVDGQNYGMCDAKNKCTKFKEEKFRVKSVKTGECTSCDWPFTYEGVTYTKGQCKYWSKGYWCATKTTTIDGIRKYKAGYYGFCDEQHSCTKFTSTVKDFERMNGKCYFPFIYKGLRYDGCIKKDKYVKGGWCSTKYKYSSDNWVQCTPEGAGAKGRLYSPLIMGKK